VNRAALSCLRTVPPFITRSTPGAWRGPVDFQQPSRTQGEMQDFALNRVRRCSPPCPRFAPPPFGGNQRTISSRSIPISSSSTAFLRMKPSPRHAGQPGDAVGNIATGTLNRIARTNAALGGNLPDLLGTPIRQNRDHGLPARHRNHRKRHRSDHCLRHVNGRRTVYIRSPSAPMRPRYR